MNARYALLAAIVDRLRRATNDHDLEAVVACFTTDFRNETPAHPERGFTGTFEAMLTQLCAGSKQRLQFHGMTPAQSKNVRSSKR